MTHHSFSLQEDAFDMRKYLTTAVPEADKDSQEEKKATPGSNPTLTEVYGQHVLDLLITC